MKPSEPNSFPRFRPRVSLLTNLFLMAIAACGITIWQLWHEVEPLREENRQLRDKLGQLNNELGHLNIDDPTRIYAIQLNTGEIGHWKWRIYLPPGGRYREFCYRGTLPSIDEYGNGPEFFERLKNGAEVSGTEAFLEPGEFTLDARLVKEDGRWQLVCQESGGRGISRHGIAFDSGDWLSDPRGYTSDSGLDPRAQRKIAPGTPIKLLKVTKPIIVDFSNGGYSVTEQRGEVEGFVLWYE
jgi:hypothetical protein